MSYRTLAPVFSSGFWPRDLQLSPAPDMGRTRTLAQANDMSEFQGAMDDLAVLRGSASTLQLCGEPMAVRARKLRAAVTIQTFVRGFLARSALSGTVYMQARDGTRSRPMRYRTGHAPARAGGRGEAAWARMGRVLPTLVARSQTFAPGRVSLERPFCAGTRVLSFFGQKCTICKGFMQWDCSGCAGARVLRECNCKTLNTSSGARVLRLFDSKSC